MITYRKELFARCISELVPLFALHDKELTLAPNIAPCAPRWEEYIAAEGAGVFHLITVRDDDRLVGYIMYFVRLHLHHATSLVGIVDIYWLHPNYRRGFVGLYLIDAMEQSMRQLKAKMVYLGYRASGTRNAKLRGLGRVLKRKGYKAVDVIAYKVLE